jgi:hypothetical protein
MIFIIEDFITCKDILNNLEALSNRSLFYGNKLSLFYCHHATQ